MNQAWGQSHRRKHWRMATTALQRPGTPPTPHLNPGVSTPCRRLHTLPHDITGCTKQAVQPAPSPKRSHIPITAARWPRMPHRSSFLFGLVSYLFCLWCILVLLLLDLSLGYIVFVLLFSSYQVLFPLSATDSIFSLIRSTCFILISLLVFTCAVHFICSAVLFTP
ncbi:hypothetical protein AMECASPLE_019143 [Ameca splendens]|uniref:Uncharacterized protein n=1 Tax=Ameca splendens TaxID=208324 RepID=A0ABV0Y3E4_9TELE